MITEIELLFHFFLFLISVSNLMSHLFSGKLLFSGLSHFAVAVLFGITRAEAVMVLVQVLS